MARFEGYECKIIGGPLIRACDIDGVQDDPEAIDRVQDAISNPNNPWYSILPNSMRIG